VEILTTRARRLAALLTVALASWSAAVAQDGTIVLGWDPVAHPDLAGYRVLYGTAPGEYSTSIDTPPAVGWTIEDLEDCTTYVVAVLAVDLAGNPSAAASNEVSGWPRPRIDPVSVVPVPIEGATVYLLELTGANFQTGASVVFEDPEIAVQSIEDQGCRSVAVTIEVPAGAPRGALRFAVVNPDQVHGIGVLPVGFSIVPGVIRADRFEGFAE